MCGFVWKRDAAINSGCVCKGVTAINETARSFCAHSKRDAAMHGCRSKRHLKPMKERTRQQAGSGGSDGDIRQAKCGPGMEFWELEDHEVTYSWLRASKMWPGNGVLGARRPRSGLQLAPDGCPREIFRGCPRRFGCCRKSAADSRRTPGELPDAAPTPLRSHDALF